MCHVCGAGRGAVYRGVLTFKIMARNNATAKVAYYIHMQPLTMLSLSFITFLGVFSFNVPGSKKQYASISSALIPISSTNILFIPCRVWNFWCILKPPSLIGIYPGPCTIKNLCQVRKSMYYFPGRFITRLKSK